MPVSNFKVLGGSSNPLLVEDVIQQLKHKTSDWSLKPVDCLLDKFNNGETRIEINNNVRGKDVYIIQSFTESVNDELMELMLILDSLERSDVRSISLILPIFPYAREDKKTQSRSPISARVIADMLQNFNISRIITFDLHAPQIQGFFTIAVDNLYSSILFLPHMNKFTNDVISVSPDSGGTERATHYAKKLDCPMSFCYKHRNKPGEISNMKLIGDVNNKDCLLVDDMIDSGNSIINCTNILKESGALSVNVFATHGIFSGNAVENLSNSEIDNIYVTDSIPQNAKVLKNNKFNIVSVAPLLGEVILRLSQRKSLSKLFV